MSSEQRDCTVRSSDVVPTSIETIIRCETFCPVGNGTMMWVDFSKRLIDMA